MKKASINENKLNAVYDAYYFSDFYEEMSDEIQKILQKYGAKENSKYINEGLDKSKADEIWDEVREVVAKFAEENSSRYMADIYKKKEFEHLLESFNLKVTNKGRIIIDAKKESDLDRVIREETEAIDSYQLAIDNSKNDLEKELYKHIQEEEIEHREELIYFKETGKLKLQKKPAEDSAAINDDKKRNLSMIIKTLNKVDLKPSVYSIKKDQEGYVIHFDNIYKGRAAYVALKAVFGEEYVIEFEYENEAFVDITVLE